MMVQRPRPDYALDSLLTDFGRETLADRYAAPGEGPQDIFARVAGTYADDTDHAARLYHYMSHLWFMPATPVLTNGGLDRGLPISCYLNGVEDSMSGIIGTWSENAWLGSYGGGIGTYWGGVRAVGEKIKGVGKTSGVVPFIKVMDSMTMAVAQGSQRRGAGAAYLDVSHPEVEEFLKMRVPSGDLNRKALHLHHGLNVSDAFMVAVRDRKPWDLISPKDGSVRRTVDAWDLWTRILDTRLQTGEPYLVFTDTASRAMPTFQRDAGLRVRQSNLCAEIMLHAGLDQHGIARTAVCCLSSVNAEKYPEWRDHPTFVEDIMRFLDNVLQDFIDNAPVEMSAAAYSASRERSVGLGLMGFHSFLQSQEVPFDSPLAKSWNMRLFKHLRQGADVASVKLALEKEPCPDAAEHGVMERFSHKLAVAPTASISIICGGTSPGIDPIPANVYTHKTLTGTAEVRNPYLARLLQKHGRDDDQTWGLILASGGSVQHLDFLTQEERDVFKTEFEIDQRWVIELAADRAPLICQSQSLNLFLLGNTHRWDLHMLHWTAWERGVKSLYYLRSKSVRRGVVDLPGTTESFIHQAPIFQDYPECLACQ